MGYVPRGELISEITKKQEQINLARQNLDEYVEVEPTLKEMVLSFKERYRYKYETEQENEKKLQINSLQTSLEKHELNQQELDSIDEQRETKKLSVDKKKASDTLKKLDYISYAMELPKLDKEQTKKGFGKTRQA